MAKHVSKSLDGTQSELRQRVEGLLAENPTFWIESAFRSPQDQERLWKAFLAGTGAPANPPNSSKHETGEAVDVGCEWPEQPKRREAFKRWGLWVRYSHEPWHVELDKNRGPIPKIIKETEDDDMPKPDTFVGACSTPNLKGSWRLQYGGGVFTHGEAPFYGSFHNLRPETKKASSGEFIEIETVESTGGYRIYDTIGNFYDFNEKVFKELQAAGLIK